MPQRDREDIRGSLTRKGFIEENNDHYFYKFVYKDKETSIFTKLSKGSKYKTLHQSLLSLMSRQLKLTNLQFLEFVDCDLDENRYIEILKEKKFLK
jgi:hypothetical protein